MIVDTILCGDALERLRELPDACIQCCVTSPPYWGLRDYGVAGQIGLEATPDEWVARMVEVFAEVRRVLRSDGTLWLNLGDCYANDTKWGGNGSGPTSKNYTSGLGGYVGQKAKRKTGLKPKDLIGLPWMLAFALRADGWYLRADCIWAKTNPMPESVRDRPTKAHEYLFLLAKSERYYYDAEAIREEAQYGRGIGTDWSRARHGDPRDSRTTKPGTHTPGDGAGGRNKRSVWTVATQPFSGAKLVADYVGADGRPYRVSPDCPVHGPSRGSRTWQKGGCGEQPDQLSPHTPDSGGSRGQAHASEYSPIPSHGIQDSGRDTSRGQTAGSTSESRTACADAGVPRTRPDNSDMSPVRDGSPDCDGSSCGQTASLHSSETSRTALVPATSSACTASARTAVHTPDTSASHESNEPSGHTLWSNTSQADSPAHPSAQMPRRSGRTSSSSACLNGSTAQCTCQIITVDHFATFPPALIEPCVLAGSAPRVCEACGAPWRRVVTASGGTIGHSWHDHHDDAGLGQRVTDASGKGYRLGDSPGYQRATLGWRPTCRCQHNTGAGKSLVLDPFMGAGTVACVARRHSRHYLGIELNPAYIALAEERIANEIQPVLWSIA